MAGAAMRRSDKEIVDRAEIDRIFDEATVLRLGLVDGDRPYVVPLNFAHEGDTIWLHCAGTGHKLDCLSANPAVCVEVDRLLRITTGTAACGNWTSHYESVIGHGKGKVVDDEPSRLRGLRAIMRKYSGRDDWEFNPTTLKKTVVVRIDLDSVIGKRSPAAS
jgi:uncharacterized protein